MKPEEAKPIEMIDENGKAGLWFTAKETAEIARAYAEVLDESTDKWAPDSVRDEVIAWRKLFEEWSK